MKGEMRFEADYLALDDNKKEGSTLTWKIAAFATVSLGLGVLAGYATSSSSTFAPISAQTTSDFPGRCTKNADCTNGFVCISVDSKIPGLEKLSMCIPPGDTCSGRIAGACPTFSAWPTKYRAVMPVCAFQVAPNCKNPLKTDDVVATNSSNATNVDPVVGSINPNETVDCYSRNFTVNDKSTVVNGIYQCIDVQKYRDSNGGHIQNLTDQQILDCGGNSTGKSLILCGGQGTCTPKTAFAQEYQCKCNKGYDADKYCSKPTSNECANYGQCGALGTCKFDTNSSSGSCECKKGSVGNQCAQCDTTKGDAACNNRGTCETNGTCTCNTGYAGTFCNEKLNKDGTKTDAKGGSGTGKGNDSAAQKISMIVLFVVGLVMIA